MRREIIDGRVIVSVPIHDVIEAYDESQRPEPDRSIAVEEAKIEGDRYRRISLDYAGLD